MARLPNLHDWRAWRFADYLGYFNSFTAVRQRTLRGDREFKHFYESLSSSQRAAFLGPVRAQFIERINVGRPDVSVIIPAHNEFTELVPSLISFTRLKFSGVSVELIVTDNNSSDYTQEIVELCGAKLDHCYQKGVAFARKSGFEAADRRSRYIWITDADTRVIPPIRNRDGYRYESTVLDTNFRCLEENQNALGVSTGACLEYTHWSYRVLHSAAEFLGRTTSFSFWSGRNQFIRRDAIEEMGGMDTSVDHNEDHHRQYQLARLGKKLKKDVLSGARHPEFFDPVYSSGRRHGSFTLVFKHLIDELSRKELPKDEFGFPIHHSGVEWRDVRRD